jgi:hypothetical protein
MLGYSAYAVGTHLHDGSVGQRLSHYLDRLLDGAADRLAPRVADRVAAQLDSRIATLEVLLDQDALDDLRASSEDAETDLTEYERIRREAGLA